PRRRRAASGCSATSRTRRAAVPASSRTRRCAVTRVAIMTTHNSTPDRIIVGITGASGVIYGIRALELLAEAGGETDLVISKAAELTMTYETDIRAADLRARASRWYSAGDIGAAISSGSFRTKGMLIVPCSVRSMSEIATGITSSLISRAADVVLK